MHEEWRKGGIKTTYQWIEAWNRLKLRLEEGFWWKRRVWIERKWRGIKVFEWEWNQVDPRKYIDPGISIDRGGIERCREQNLDRSKSIKELSTVKIYDVSREASSFYRANREFKKKGLMDRAMYRVVLRKIQKTSVEEVCVERHWEGIELLLS